MSSNYQGLLKGTGDAIIRRGGKTDGVLVSVQGYIGGVVLRMKDNGYGSPLLIIEVADEDAMYAPTLHGVPVGSVVYTGLMRDLVQCDQLVPYLNGVPLADYPLGKNEAEHE